MGNRVVIQFVKGAEYSPAIYGHWYGSSAAAMLVELRKQMAGRVGDLDYIAARCIGRMIGADYGSTGFGLWNAEHKLTDADSHGDAGVYVVDVSTPKWQVAVIGGHSCERGKHVSGRDIVFCVESEES